MASVRNMSSIRSNSSLLQVSVQVVATVTVGVGAWFMVRTSRRRKTKKYPPLCPAGLVETVLAVSGGLIQEFCIKYFQKCGKIFRIRLPLPGAPMVVVVANTEDARAIYRDTETCKPPILYDSVKVFASEQNIVSLKGGEGWFHRRKAINPAFAPKNIKGMNDIATQVAEDWVHQKLGALRQGMVDHVSLDIGKEMIELTISVICKAALDYDIDQEEKTNLLLEIKLGWEEFTMKTSFNPLRKYLTWFLPERRRAFQSLDFLQKFAFRVIDNYKQKETPTPDTVLDMIIKNPSYANDKERAADIIMIVFAGHDTTGYTLSLALRQLALNPTEQEKLREDLAKINKNPTDEEESSYLKAVITETMRMHPVVPVSGFRQVGRDFITEYGGYLIPKGSIVFQTQIAIFRDASIFEDPFSFQPSRWLDASEAAKRAFFPFALGKRNCVGQPLANAELYTVLPRFVREFKFLVDKEGQIHTPATVRLDNCWLKISKAK